MPDELPIMDLYGFTLDPKATNLFVDSININYGGKSYEYSLERKVYVPRVGDKLVMNTVAYVRYLTPTYLAAHLDDLIQQGQDILDNPKPN